MIKRVSWKHENHWFTRSILLLTEEEGHNYFNGLNGPFHPTTGTSVWTKKNLNYILLSVKAMQYKMKKIIHSQDEELLWNLNLFHCLFVFYSGSIVCPFSMSLLNYYFCCSILLLLMWLILFYNFLKYNIFHPFCNKTWDSTL